MRAFRSACPLRTSTSLSKEYKALKLGTMDLKEQIKLDKRKLPLRQRRTCFTLAFCT